MSHIDRESFERYKRQIAIPEIQEQGQEKIRNAKILLIGAGGLASSAAFYLAAAGIGNIGIADDDRVEMSNLNRQILHDPGRISMLKAVSAKSSLERFNPEIQIKAYPKRFQTRDELIRILGDYDLAVDCSDNYMTRFALNDACIQTGKPWVHGAVYGFEGQAMTFVPGQGPCYRCLYPSLPGDKSSPDAPVGVIGVSPGIIGMIQAAEALKYILGKGNLLVGRLLFMDLLEMSFSEFSVHRNEDCPSCSEK
jgi:adenylyltransferase/sulfurtransferase